MRTKLMLLTSITAFSVVLAINSAWAVKPPQNQAPEVVAFDVPSTAPSPVPIVAFDAIDSDGTVAGYLITETSVPPAAADPGWSVTAPTEYNTSSIGSVTLYAWAKDDKDAVSESLVSDIVDIPQSPIDADTLDGIDSTGFSLDGHTHFIADVNSLDAALAGKADASHDHDSIYQKKYANVVVVAKNGGDFTDPITAIDFITDASASNPYLLKIMPGIYDLGAGSLQMKAFVDVEGSGPRNTTLTSSTNPTVRIGVGNCTLTNMKILNTYTDPGLCIRLDNTPGNVVLKDIEIDNDVTSWVYGFYGIWGTASGAGPVRLENITINSSVEVSTFHHRGIDITTPDTGQVVILNNIRIVMSGGNLAFGLIANYGLFEVSNSYIEVSNGGVGGGMVPVSTGSVLVKLADTVLVAKDSTNITRSLQVDGRDQPVAAVVEARNCEFRSSSGLVEDAIYNIYGGFTYAANSLIQGNTNSGTKLINCFDQNYDPIP